MWKQHVKLCEDGLTSHGTSSIAHLRRGRANGRINRFILPRRGPNTPCKGISYATQATLKLPLHRAKVPVPGSEPWGCWNRGNTATICKQASLSIKHIYIINCNYLLYIYIYQQTSKTHNSINHSVLKTLIVND